MKNKIFSMLALALSVFALSGCEKELMDYEGKDCLYFDVRRGPSWFKPYECAHWNYSEVTFGNILSNDTTIAVKISATGQTKDFDRSFQVIVTKDSTDLEEGTEYEPLKPEYTIKAGQTHSFVDVTFHRTARMTNDTLRFQLQIVPNEHFHTMFDDYKDYPGPHEATQPKVEFNFNHDARFHNMFVDDVLIQPDGWMGSDAGGGLFGKFSDVKFRFMMQVSGTTIFDYTREKMSSARATAIGQQVAEELVRRARAKDPVIDKDGTMMWVMAVQSGKYGKDAWTAFTKPEDYLKTHENDK